MSDSDGSQSPQLIEKAPATPLPISRLSKKQKRNSPLQQTKRTRLQQKRCGLNEQIKKELRLKTGAENLLRVTKDEKVRSQIQLELSFVESNIQLLREQFADLNTSVDAYQNNALKSLPPLLAFGFKETTAVDYGEYLKDFILEHYSERGEEFQLEIKQLEQLRSQAQRPTKNDQGITALFHYYNQLQHIDKRFFYGEPSAYTALYFEWFDSFTGTSVIQKSIAFEKGSILFNLAALYTQIAVKTDRSTLCGLEKAIEGLEKSAGALSYLRDNFSYAPSADMQWDTLDFLNALLLAQAQECHFERLIHDTQPASNMKTAFKLATEAERVSEMYVTAKNLYVRCIPEPWESLVAIKVLLYKGFAHFWTAQGVLLIESTPTSIVKRLFRGHFRERKGLGKTWDPLQPPETLDERKTLAARHLRRSLQLLDESIDVAQLSANWRKLSENGPLSGAKTQVTQLSDSMELSLESNENDIEAAGVRGSTEFHTSPAEPEFASYPVTDLFRELGPLSVFCASNHWTSPKKVRLIRYRGSAGYGFSIAGSRPVAISAVEQGGLAKQASLQPGDIIIEIGSTSTKWATHDEVVQLIREAREDLRLTVVTLMNQQQNLSPAHSYSTLSSSAHTSSPPSTISVPIKFRPNYFDYKNQPNTVKSENAAKKRGWQMKNLLTMKRLMKSEPELSTNHELFY